MKGGRLNQLNFEADRRPGDPTAVSDPKCWLTGEQAQALRRGLICKIQSLKYAETYRDQGVWDLSGDAQDGLGRENKNGCHRF